MKDQQVDLNQYYSDRKSIFAKKASELKQKIFVNSLLRVLVFVSGGIAIYYLSFSVPLIFTSLFLFGAVFLFLVKRQVNLKADFDHNKAMSEINDKELKFMKHEFMDFDSGDDLKTENHPFSLDIDIFGRGSFFQFINRTVLSEAREKLGLHLTDNDIHQIEKRQEIIQQLAKENDWSQHFLAEAYSINTEVSEVEILEWLASYKNISNGIFKILPIIMAVISLTGMVLYAAGIIPESLLILVLLIGLGISSIKVKSINETSSRMAKSYHLFRQYARLLERIENKEFSCSLSDENLKKNQPSSRINHFSRLLNRLDQRSNILSSIFLNGFFLRDIWLCSKIDMWVKENKNDVESWFALLHDYDKYISLGIFAFNHHKTAIFPDLIDDKQILATELGHPLIPADKRVSNNYTIDNEEFNIITGANMAGKSTFLRTIGLSIIMANSGLPIIAKSFGYRPIKLISSMRTSDSLSENESYFFAELKRLKYVMGMLESDTYFVILDEILKGTNSKDKAEGSEKFLRRISKSPSCGIIATHDLSLCRVADDISTVYNKYFDAEIVNDQLYFDYKLKQGICQNMNASFLMKKMDIV